MGHPQGRWSVLLMTQHGGILSQFQGDHEGCGALPRNPMECGFFDHWPEEIQVNETSTHHTEVQALSDLLYSGPALRQAPTPLRQARVPAGEQGRQPTPLVTEARQPRLLHRPHPGRARPAVAQSAPRLLAPPGLSSPQCVTRGVHAARDAKTTT